MGATLPASRVKCSHTASVGAEQRRSDVLPEARPAKTLRLGVPEVAMAVVLFNQKTDRVFIVSLLPESPG